MAEKENYIPLTRLLTVVFTAICMFAIIATADAQHRDKTDSSSSPAASATTITPPAASPDRTEDPGKTMPDTTTPGATTAEVETRPEAAATAGITDATTGRPRRTKPERPFYFTAQFTQRYDDNLLLVSEGAGDQKSDLVSIPVFGFGLERVKPRSLLRLDYQGGAELYRRFSNLNGFLHSLDFTYEYDLSKRTMVFVSDRFLRRPITTGFGLFGTGIEPGALNLFTASRSSVNDFSTGFTHQLSRFSTVRGIYNYSLSRFNDPRLINTNEQTGEFGYNRRATRKLDYDFAYRVSRFTGIDDLTTHTLMPSIRYSYKRDLRFRLGVGPQFVNAPTSNNLFLSGFVEVTYGSRDTIYGLTYSTGVGSGGGLAVATRNHTLFGTLDHAFTRKLRNEFRAGYSRSSSGVGAGPIAAAGITSTGFIIENRVAYTIGDKFAIFADYSYSRQLSAGTVENTLNRNIFSVGVNFDTRRTDRAPLLRSGRF
jgi:hypothetical protein